MKVVHLSHTDIKWGASRAAFGIFQALKDSGTKVEMLVQKKFSNDKNTFGLSDSFIDDKKTKARIILDAIPIHLYTKREIGRFSFGSTGKNISKFKLIEEADIIHLHWINEGFISIKNIYEMGKKNKPILWTLHDMWAFTGGCHYAGACLNYKHSCGNCPYLKSPAENDFSFKILKRKKELFKNINLTIVTPSNWLRNCAKESSLFKESRIEVIPYAIDTDLYNRADKSEVRKELNLIEDKIYILFGSMSVTDERKGFRFFKESLNLLYNENPELKEKIKILVFGRAEEKMREGIPFEIFFKGRISDDKILVKLYNASDFFVAPSLEDNYPNTVMESLACGLPVVAFNTGGLSDMITHKQNGYLADYSNAVSLKEGVEWLIMNKDEIYLRENARKFVLERNTPGKIAESYNKLYSEVLKKK